MLKRLGYVFVLSMGYLMHWAVVGTDSVEKVGSMHNGKLLELQTAKDEMPSIQSGAVHILWAQASGSVADFLEALTMELNTASPTRLRAFASEISASLTNPYDQKAYPLARIAYPMIVAKLADSDPDAAWDYALSQRSLEFRYSALNGIALRYAIADPEAGLTKIKGLPEQDRSQLLSTLLAATIESRPRWTIANMVDLNVPREWYRSIFVPLGRKDHSLAIQLYQGLEPESDRVAALVGLVQGWSDDDPTAAAEFLATSVHDHPQLLEAAEHVAVNLGVLNLDQSMEWISETFEGNDRANLGLSVVQEKLNRTSDFASLATFVDELPLGELRTSAVRELSDSWAGDDVESTLDWLSDLPPDDARHRGILSAFIRWGEQDLQQAITYASQLETNDTTHEIENILRRKWRAQFAGDFPEFLEKTPERIAQ